jgi:hypothetical protein
MELDWVNKAGDDKVAHTVRYMFSYGAPFVLLCSNQLILFLSITTRDKKRGTRGAGYTLPSPLQKKSLQTYEVGAPDASLHVR